MKEALTNPGFLAAVPIGLLFLFGFIGPLALVVAFSFMPASTFSLMQMPTLQNYADIFANSYYISFVLSLFLAAVTVAILLVICYPLAVALVRVFGKKGAVLTLLITAPLFVADNLRLTGWMLFFVKGGVLPGTLGLIGIEMESILYTTGATLFGLVYIYLPFMLFPMVLGVSMVPPQAREAAFDLGATRFQILKEVDIPLAMPGIMMGALMCFILTAGAITEAKVMGGTAVVTIAQDIQKEFTFAQNWPRGSALSVLMILLAGALSLTLLKRIDLDSIFGRK
ncbi:spermidine/putrescine ABC transporter permease [Pararhizobium polonicum]|uniref:Spermidine/putrescine ABC transporter permease n=1 Tax=Pararhizobium polonicum TaxID=1612624 RepID=A0A1C7P3N6_9HYPH|nr:spermidine/putrescine ABC transporter permease [Pararhizobium polonicum]